MPGQGQILLFLCLLLSLLSAVVRTEDYVYDKIPKPATEKFLSCHFHIVGSIYTCYDNAASTYNIDEGEVLHKWPTHPAECCAVWLARECIRVKANTFPDCQSAEVVAYYQAIEDKYIENGCSNYAPGRYDCKNGASSLPHRASIGLILLTSICIILIDLF